MQEQFVLPPSKTLEKVMYVSNKNRKKQESQSYDGHCKQDFPPKIARG